MWAARNTALEKSFPVGVCILVWRYRQQISKETIVQGNKQDDRVDSEGKHYLGDVIKAVITEGP